MVVDYENNIRNKINEGGVLLQAGEIIPGESNLVISVYWDLC
jgi:hypothetical protein